MNDEINLGADWDQSKRLVQHWYDICVKSNKANISLMKYMNEALDLLEVSGPNRFMVDEDEYFERLLKLLDEFGIKQEEE